MVQKKEQLKLSVFLRKLQESGKYSFCTSEYKKASGKSPVAVQATLRRAIHKGVIVTPYRSFYVIVPPEYRSLGCLPADQFIPDLMKYLDEDYYVGLLSAASYYGAAHHAPQVFQVIVKKNRPTITVGKIKIEFVAKKSFEHTHRQILNTKVGTINVSTPEMTAMDLVAYRDRCGGLDNVASVLDDLKENMRSSRLTKLAREIGPVNISQRLGYLLQFLQGESLTVSLAKYIATAKPRFTKLDPSLPAQGPKDETWRLIINHIIEVD